MAKARNVFLLQTLEKKKKKEVNRKPCGRLESRRPPVILLWQCKRRGNTQRLDGAQIDESHAHTTSHSSTQQHLIFSAYQLGTNFTFNNFFFFFFTKETEIFPVCTFTSIPKTCKQHNTSKQTWKSMVALGSRCDQV